MSTTESLFNALQENIRQHLNSQPDSNSAIQSLNDLINSDLEEFYRQHPLQTILESGQKLAPTTFNALSNDGTEVSSPVLQEELSLHADSIKKIFMKMAIVITIHKIKNDSSSVSSDQLQSLSDTLSFDFIKNPLIKQWINDALNFNLLNPVKNKFVERVYEKPRLFFQSLPTQVFYGFVSVMGAGVILLGILSSMSLALIIPGAALCALGIGLFAKNHYDKKKQEASDKEFSEKLSAECNSHFQGAGALT